MTYFYKFKGQLNDKLLEAKELSSKIAKVRNNFLIEKGLLEQGQAYYQFTFEPMLTLSQIEALGFSEKELKKDGTPRKDSKTMKNFVDEYKEKLIKNNIALNKDPQDKLINIFIDLIDFSGGRFSYTHFSDSETVYYKGNCKLKEGEEVIEINGLEFYEAYEKNKVRIKEDE